MKKIVATVALAVFVGALAAAISLVGFGSAPGPERASTYAVNGSQRAQVDQVATHFRDGGAWFVSETVTGRDAGCAAALGRAGVVLTILGLAGFAIVLRIRLRAEGLVQLRAR
ncbi:MAG: hypothetical protein JWO83_4655 [Caulobacteraceae bacterium]|jgi:hypothetical protein|nr:hypothetical protein [Caulobacteraceae bacterium]